MSYYLKKFTGKHHMGKKQRFCGCSYKKRYGFSPWVRKDYDGTLKVLGSSQHRFMKGKWGLTVWHNLMTGLAGEDRALDGVYPEFRNAFNIAFYNLPLGQVDELQHRQVHSDWKVADLLGSDCCWKQHKAAGGQALVVCPRGQYWAWSCLTSWMIWTTGQCTLTTLIGNAEPGQGVVNKLNALSFTGSLTSWSMKPEGVSWSLAMMNSLTNFNNRKYKVLNARMNNPMHHRKLKAEWLVTGSAD